MPRRPLLLALLVLIVALLAVSHTIVEAAEVTVNCNAASSAVNLVGADASSPRTYPDGLVIAVGPTGCSSIVVGPFVSAKFVRISAVDLTVQVNIGGSIVLTGIECGEGSLNSCLSIHVPVGCLAVEITNNSRRIPPPSLPATVFEYALVALLKPLQVYDQFVLSGNSVTFMAPDAAGGDPAAYFSTLYVSIIDTAGLLSMTPRPSTAPGGWMLFEGNIINASSREHVVRYDTQGIVFGHNLIGGIRDVDTLEIFDCVIDLQVEGGVNSAPFSTQQQPVPTSGLDSWAALFQFATELTNITRPSPNLYRGCALRLRGHFGFKGNVALNSYVRPTGATTGMSTTIYRASLAHRGFSVDVNATAIERMQVMVNMLNPGVLMNESSWAMSDAVLRVAVTSLTGPCFAFGVAILGRLGDGYKMFSFSNLVFESRLRMLQPTADRSNSTSVAAHLLVIEDAFAADVTMQCTGDVVFIAHLAALPSNNSSTQLAVNQAAGVDMSATLFSAMSLIDRVLVDVFLSSLRSNISLDGCAPCHVALVRLVGGGSNVRQNQGTSSEWRIAASDTSKKLRMNVTIRRNLRGVPVISINRVVSVSVFIVGGTVFSGIAYVQVSDIAMTVDVARSGFADPVTDINDVYVTVFRVLTDMSASAAATYWDISAIAVARSALSVTARDASLFLPRILAFMFRVSGIDDISVEECDLSVLVAGRITGDFRPSVLSFVQGVTDIASIFIASSSIVVAQTADPASSINTIYSCIMCSDPGRFNAIASVMLTSNSITTRNLTITSDITTRVMHVNCGDIFDIGSIAVSQNTLRVEHTRNLDTRDIQQQLVVLGAVDNQNTLVFAWSYIRRVYSISVEQNSQLLDTVDSTGGITIECLRLRASLENFELLTVSSNVIIVTRAVVRGNTHYFDLAVFMNRFPLVGMSAATAATRTYGGTVAVSWNVVEIYNLSMSRGASALLGIVAARASILHLTAQMLVQHNTVVIHRCVMRGTVIGVYGFVASSTIAGSQISNLTTGITVQGNTINATLLTANATGDAGKLNPSIATVFFNMPFTASPGATVFFLQNSMFVDFIGNSSSSSSSSSNNNDVASPVIGALHLIGAYFHRLEDVGTFATQNCAMTVRMARAEHASVVLFWVFDAFGVSSASMSDSTLTVTEAVAQSVFDVDLFVFVKLAPSLTAPPTAFGSTFVTVTTSSLIVRDVTVLGLSRIHVVAILLTSAELAFVTIEHVLVNVTVVAPTPHQHGLQQAQQPEITSGLITSLITSLLQLTDSNVETAVTVRNTRVVCDINLPLTPTGTVNGATVNFLPAAASSPLSSVGHVDVIDAIMDFHLFPSASTTASYFIYMITSDTHSLITDITMTGNRTSLTVTTTSQPLPPAWRSSIAAVPTVGQVVVDLITAVLAPVTVDVSGSTSLTVSNFTVSAVGSAVRFFSGGVQKSLRIHNGRFLRNVTSFRSNSFGLYVDLAFVSSSGTGIADPLNATQFLVEGVSDHLENTFNAVKCLFASVAERKDYPFASTTLPALSAMTVRNCNMTIVAGPTEVFGTGTAAEQYVCPDAGYCSIFYVAEMIDPSLRQPVAANVTLVGVKVVIRLAISSSSSSFDVPFSIVTAFDPVFIGPLSNLFVDNITTLTAKNSADNLRRPVMFSVLPRGDVDTNLLGSRFVFGCGQNSWSARREVMFARSAFGTGTVVQLCSSTSISGTSSRATHTLELSPTASAVSIESATASDSGVTPTESPQRGNTSSSSASSTDITTRSNTESRTQLDTRSHTDNTATATDTIPPPPPTWIPSAVSQQAAVATSIASLLSGAPGAALFMQKMKMIETASKCSNAISISVDNADDNDGAKPEGLPPLGFDASPTKLAIGNANNVLRMYNGAMIGNSVLVAALLLIQFFIAYVLVQSGRRTSIEWATADVHFPGLALILVIILAVPTVSVFGSVAAFTATSTQPKISVTSVLLQLALALLAFCIIPLGSLTWVAKALNQGSGKIAKLEKVAIKRSKVSRDASLLRQAWATIKFGFAYLFEGNPNWTSTQFVQRYADAFDVIRVPMWVVFDLAVALFVGLLSGISVVVDSRSSCLVFSVLILIAVTLHMLALLWTKPNTARFDAFFSKVTSVFSVVAAIFALLDVADIKVVDFGNVMGLVGVVSLVFSALAFVGAMAPVLKRAARILRFTRSTATKSVRRTKKEKDDDNKEKSKKRDTDKEKKKQHQQQSQRRTAFNLADALNDDDASGNDGTNLLTEEMHARPKEQKQQHGQRAGSTAKFRDQHERQLDADTSELLGTNVRKTSRNSKPSASAEPAESAAVPVALRAESSNRGKKGKKEVISQSAVAEL